jgi:hypothetical protein
MALTTFLRSSMKKEIMIIILTRETFSIWEPTFKMTSGSVLSGKPAYRE